MNRCRAPLFLPLGLEVAAVELVSTRVLAEDVPQFLYCELAEHIEGEHAAHLLFAEEATGRAVWVFWREETARVQLQDRCTDKSESGNLCLLFEEHNGNHFWPEDLAWLTEHGRASPCPP
ncbi:hypothetical protein [Streptomyces sp. cg36]|uniref:hypothetical protein n=1 Tax=Streptomyces sp. cg36 TaxID=3238798 RepID=UPI0034E2CE72